MDFQTQVLAAGGTAKLAADALLVVVVGDTVPAAAADLTAAAPPSFATATATRGGFTPGTWRR